jgi:hypothetical protein
LWNAGELWDGWDFKPYKKALQNEEMPGAQSEKGNGMVHEMDLSS